MTDPFAAIKPIAFYLPQFYETEYNNKWWGEGFTEWHSSRSGHPLFENHYQPHSPSDLGYYDQSKVETLKSQIELAKRFGVHGFCHYFYWFNGKRVLEKPTELFLETPSLKMPFCLCWANENWTRRWDGAEREILIQQVYDKANYAEFAKCLAPYFSDQRYITADGKVLFLIYRPQEVLDIEILIGEIKKQAIQCGHKGALILGAETFVQYGAWSDPRKMGLDGAVEFPPHGVKMSEYRLQPNNSRKFEGKVLNAFDAHFGSIARSSPEYPLFRGLFPSWDNTARLKDRANVFIGSSPELFEHWLTALCQWTTKNHDKAHQFIFINAWNEWAEGAHLEPDLINGTAYLETILRVLNNKSDLVTSVEFADLFSPERKVRQRALQKYRKQAQGPLGMALDISPKNKAIPDSKINSAPPFRIRKESGLDLLRDVLFSKNKQKIAEAVRKLLFVEVPYSTRQHARKKLFYGLRRIYRLFNKTNND